MKDWQKNATSTFRRTTTCGYRSALLNDPELILADEPTGNLDPQTSAEVLGIEENQCQRKTIIMATHDYALLMKFPSKH
jgi:cell division transport system ATP-binding protein